MQPTSISLGVKVIQKNGRLYGNCVTGIAALQLHSAGSWACTTAVHQSKHVHLAASCIQMVSSQQQVLSLSKALDNNLHP